MKKITLFMFCLLAVLTITAQTSFQTLVPFGSSWKYLDDGTSPGSNWKLNGFDETGWKTGNGKFGHGIADAATNISFGPNVSQKYITTYFRKQVNVTNPTAYTTAFTINMKRDDGVVVYLNGTEYYRAKMPAGTPTNTTLATSTGDGGATPVTFTIKNTKFLNGANTIAVEIHLQSPSSPNMAFDIEMTGTGPTATDVTPPTVQSINRLNPATATTNATSLTWRVMFSEPVTGADAGDFLLSTISGTATGTISSITPSGTGGTTYDVTVNAVTGTGELRLDLKNSGTGIADGSGNGINTGFNTGQTYTIQNGDITAPSVTSISRQIPTTESTSANSVTWRIIFTERVNNVDINDVTLVTASGNAAGVVSAVAPSGTAGTTYDFTINSITGVGVLRLDLKNTGTGITDIAGNPIAGGFTTGQVYTITNIAEQALFGFGSNWNYLDNGTDPGANWKSLAFNDAAWKTGNGKFGHGIADATTTVSYGPNASQKYITTYFRKVVNIANPSEYSTAFTLNLKRDDGVIVYVNGTEHYRSKMATGTPTYTTLASGAGDAGVTPISFSIKTNKFVSGNNIIAVEIHLQSPSSPQMAFDLELKGTGPAQPPVDPVPVAPTLSSPVNAATDITATTIFNWNTVPGATRYRIEISESQTFTSTFLAQGDLTTTSLEVSNLLPGKTYYWRVRGSNTTGDGAWSTVWSFVTATPPVAPAAPVLINPADAATEIPVTTTLSWNASADALQYEIEVATSQAFSPTFFTQAGLTATSAEVVGLTQNTIYYWRVRASNTAGNSDWSAVRSFTTVNPPPPVPPAAPALNSPANAATEIPVSATLSWVASPNAIDYRVEVSESETFSSTFFAQGSISATSIAVAGMTNSTIYYWRVRGANAGGDGDWSVVRSFTTVAPVTPPAISLVHYWNFNNTASLLTPTLSVNGGSMTASLAPTSVIEAGTANEFNGANSRNGDPVGAHFRLNNPNGSSVTLNIPSTGYELMIIKYETRRSAQGGEKQQISYSTDGSSYVFLQDVSVVNGVPVVVAIDLSSIPDANNNANLKLKIQFEQGVGGTGGNDRIDNITVEGKSLGGVALPGQVITNTPANNTQETPLRPDFSWTETEDAAGYLLQVATDNLFTNVVAEKTVSGQTTHKLESPLTVATDYHWRVRAFNAGGDGQWSDVKTFKTILQSVVYSLAINEAVSTNNGLVTDEDGSNEDWMEIHNYGTTPINLEGIGLTDLPSTPFKWIFPAKTIAPGAFIIVWASNKNRVNPALPLHTNFAISSGGEELVLTSPDGVTIDVMPAVTIPADASRGRQPDGTGSHKYFLPATPGAANTGSGVEGFLTKPGFSQPPGIYQNTISLAITHTDLEATIRYTLDGSEPVVTSPAYTGPIQLIDRSGAQNAHSMIRTNNLTSGSRMWNAPNGLVRKGTVIRARAFKTNSAESPTLTGTFLVLNGRQYTLPVLSVIMPLDSMYSNDKGLFVPGFNYFPGDDGTGNYYQKGDDWERAGSIEMFSADLNFQQNIGYRINGDYSRRFPQKSLRLVAKSKFGPNSINYKMFTDFNQASFKRLELTNAGNDWGSALMRDALGSRLVSHILPTEHNRLSVVYVNGEYWGVHFIREHIDKFMLASIYGIDPDNIDYLTRQYEIEEGEDVYYKQLLNYVQGTDLTSNENFKQVDKLMDVDNYLDYFSSQIYFGNTDWPHSNIEYWRSRVQYNPAAAGGQDGRWRWILHDMDQGFVNAQFNSVQWVTAPVNTEVGDAWPNVLMRGLLTNEKFKFGFINRIADQLNSSFITTRVNQIVDSMKAVLQPEIAEHSLRWREPSSLSSWNSKADAIKTFNTQRPAVVRQHLIAGFSLGNQLTVTLNVSDKSHGSIKINSLIINSATVGANAQQPYPWTGIYFGNVPLEFKALANPGFAFDHWVVNGQDYTTEDLIITPTGNLPVTAIFIPTTGVKPVLISPGNTVKNVAKTPAVFTWQAVPQATTYRLQVSLKQDFLAPAADHNDLTVTSANVTGLLDSALYYWRVRAVGPDGTSEWSDVRSFTTVASSTPFPATVTLVSPVSNATNVAINAILNWNASANASTYSVQVSNESNFDDLVVNQYNIGGTSYKIKGLLRNTVYFWRVKATNERGTTAWSETRSFKTSSLATNASLVGYWPLNEGSGKLLLDYSGNTNNAVLQSFDDIYWVPAVENLGLSVLARTNMFGIAPNHASLNITSQITIAAWIRPAELGTRTVVSKTAPDGYELGINTNGKVDFRFNSTTNGNTYRLQSTGTYIADGITWTHIAATFDGTTSRIYINGVLSGTVTYGAPVTIRPNTSNLYIGALAGGQRWKGVIDDVQLYSSALTETQISELVNPEVGGPAAPPVPMGLSNRPIVITEQVHTLRLYPNPVRDQMNLEFKTGISGRVSITITDALGKVCLQSNYNLATNKLSIDLLGAQLKPGVYFLSASAPGYKQGIRFVKQ
ncbi:MAG: CotH kinase family protein [Chitinophagaceae bacterium]